MVTTKTLRLDVTKKYTEPIYLVQYEVDARILDIYLSAGSLPINLTGASVVFYAKKPDGTILFNNCTVVDAVSGHVVYTVTEQMCAVAGDLRCWILVINDDAELRSIEFKVTVQPSEDDTEAIESTSEFTALDTALSTVASMVIHDGGSVAGNIPVYTDTNGDKIKDSGKSLPSGSIVGDTDTQTLSNKTFTSPLFQGAIDGWISANESWSYASPTTITVPSGAASKYKKGDKIKLTQTTVKYFSVVGVADTVLTITGGASYTLTNASITSPYYSHIENPIGFPDYFSMGTPTWTTTGTAFTNQPTINTFRMRISGPKCKIDYTVGTHATSGGTGIFIATFPAGIMPPIGDGAGSCTNVNTLVSGFSATSTVIPNAIRFGKYDGTAIASSSQYFVGSIEFTY